MFTQFYFKSSIGIIGIHEADGYITGIGVENQAQVSDKKSIQTDLIYKAYNQLNEYFEGKRKIFDLPLKFNGTQFQEKVWNVLMDIPYGETRSYKDIAAAIGNIKAVRAVGQANNRNPIMIVIPCHRVIGANGQLVGFGCGNEVKKYLLEMEKTNE